MTSKSKPQTSIVLILRKTRTGYLKLTPAHIKPGVPIDSQAALSTFNSADIELSHGLDLEDLMITAYQPQPSTSTEPMNFRVVYDDIYTVEIQKADRMSKTLHAIDRRMNALYEKLGSVTTFDQYVCRLMMVIGAHSVATRAIDKETDQFECWRYWEPAMVNSILHRIYEQEEA